LIGGGKVGEAKNFLYIIPGEDWGGGGRQKLPRKKTWLSKKFIVHLCPTLEGNYNGISLGEVFIQEIFCIFRYNKKIRL
jgi:hypothetical protein